jgi:hypothetical protein
MSSCRSFQNFLHSESAAIAAFVDEVADHDWGQSVEEEKISLKISDHVSLCPELQSYYEEDAVEFEKNRVDKAATNSNTATNTNMNTNISISREQESFSRFVRVAIIDHLITMDINISLLIAIVDINRYGAQIEELVEIVRALDILGAERRLSEYEAVLDMRLTEASKN